MDDLMLSSENFSFATNDERQVLDSKLGSILQTDLNGNLYAMLAGYQRILADNHQREQWPLVHDKLQTDRKSVV